MCGGEGNRLRPFTYTIPKPFLTSNGISPFDYIIENIKKTVTNNIYVTVKYKSKIAKKIIKNKKNSKIKIFEEKETSGTAGCIRNIIKKKLSENFIVINGDIFTKTDFSKMMNYHKEKMYDLTIGITDYQISFPYAVLKVKKGKKFFQEKPLLKIKINSGIYVISKTFATNFFKKNGNKFINMTDIIDKSKNIGTYNIGSKWIDIGHVGDFKKAYQEIIKW